MNLLVDIGNTQTKFTFEINGVLGEVQTVFDTEATSFLKDIEENSITKIIVTTVVSDSSILSLLRSTNIPILEISVDTKMGIKVEYETQGVGLDRLVNLAGAMELFPNHHCMVIDLGSAITIDIITLDGRFIGGNISPGMNLRFKALNEHTSQLPLIEFPEFTSNFGKHTKNAISNGVIQGVIYEIEGYLNNWNQQFPNIKKIITGGDARYFADQLKSSIFVEPKLTMIGLNRISKLNEHSQDLN